MYLLTPVPDGIGVGVLGWDVVVIIGNGAAREGGRRGMVIERVSEYVKSELV